MRKIALAFAVLVAAGFSSSPSSAATDEEFYNLNKNTHMLMRAGWNPSAATVEPASPAKAGKKAKKKK